MELFPNEEFLTKCLKHAFNELQEEIEEEQVRRIVDPVLEKIRGKFYESNEHNRVCKHIWSYDGHG